MRGLRALALCGSLFAWTPVLSAADLESPLEAASPVEAVREGELLLGLRPRYTWVDQAGQSENTHWASLRTTVGWRTLSYEGLRLTAELIDVSRFDEQATIPYNTTPAYHRIAGTPLYGAYYPGYYPRVADPKTTEANQLFVEYSGVPGTELRFGRQLVRIDNQRFIGAYDAAQLPQALTGILGETHIVPHLRFTAGYFARERNAYSIEHQARIGVLNARYDVDPLLKIGAYGYFQNEADTGAVTGFADNSNRIVGGRVWGGWRVVDTIELVYNAEAAQQRSFAGGDPRINAPYQRLGAGLAHRAAFVRVDWERLGSNRGVYGFQTPLGSTQLFNGRIDMFQTVPIFGVRDLRASVGSDYRNAAIRFEYHRFRSDWNDRDLGHEWDLWLTWAIDRSFSLDVGYGDYRGAAAQTRFPDTRKAWVSVEYRYR